MIPTRTAGGALASGKILVGSSAGLAAAVDMSGDATLSNAGALSIGSQKIDGANVKNVAASDTTGGVLTVYHILADQAGGADKDVTVTHKIRVLDVIVVNAAAGGASDTITVKNGTTAITDAIDTNKADKTVTRAGTIDDAQHAIAAGGTLRVTKANGANDPNCDVYVVAMRVA